MNVENFVLYESIYKEQENALDRSSSYRDFIERRRSLRFFSDKDVSQETIENIIMAASSAPSGAHKQPWTFCAISSAALKTKIRAAAEEEEYKSYNGRMSEDWLADLQKFDTDWNKPFIEIAPWIIVLFKKAFDYSPEGKKLKNYYVNESVGIAAGFFISAVHHAGLVTLTHTPSPMNFLQELLDRPDNERPYLLLPVGYPAEDAVVPVLKRKHKEEVIVFYK